MKSQMGVSARVQGGRNGGRKTLLKRHSSKREMKRETERKRKRQEGKRRGESRRDRRPRKPRVKKRQRNGLQKNVSTVAVHSCARSVTALISVRMAESATNARRVHVWVQEYANTNASGAAVKIAEGVAFVCTAADVCAAGIVGGGAFALTTESGRAVRTVGRAAAFMVVRAVDAPTVVVWAFVNMGRTSAGASSAGVRRFVLTASRSTHAKRAALCACTTSHGTPAVSAGQKKPI
mmetsp:Transcript_13175/g.25916  ORF Transcript_13175/g.25916 Transcript_13175/m.25916 type:complete len:236 (-) Transcript_13175:230-937(-)